MRRDIFEHYLFPTSLRNVEDIPMFAYVLANYEVAPITETLARIHKHNDSLRHNTSYAKDIALKLVDEVFDVQRLPGQFQQLRKPYTAQRCLSLFRTFYLAGEHKLAKSYYRKAVSLAPASLLKSSYLRKYIKSLFK
ncbi:glycosyl transferase [gamma proteobacterium IMCC2047]|nr:glycosyl transferase [gamma proteobacterium IMCC2047]